MEGRWSDTGRWVGDELRREVFFFRSRGEALYGSLYAAASPTDPGVVICNSWGYEGNQADRNAHLIALATARGGGAGMLFHYAGFGDSHGDLAAAGIETLVGAAVDAVGEARKRLPDATWALAGLMFGATVAALAARRAAVDRLLLIQPELQPSSYFARLERSARRAAQRVPARTGNAYGYPLPWHILESAPQSDAAVKRALSEFEGDGAVVRHERPPRGEAIPERFEDVVVDGSWRFGSRQKPHLADAASRWLLRAAEVSR